MPDEIKIKSTSLTSVEAPPIILRENSNNRLAFYPLIVENSANKNASVKGTFRLQRKSKKDEWENYKDIDANKLKSGEWTQLALHSEELYILIKELDKCYKIYEKFGLLNGEHNIIITNENISKLVSELLKNGEAVAKIVELGNVESIAQIISSVLKNPDPKTAVKVMEKLDLDDIEKIHLYARVSSLTKILESWESNKNNSNENFWQNLFEQESWILSQLLPYPVILIEDKAFMGGKNLGGTGGNYTDFLYKNNITKNICIVEIKTPKTNLIQTELYRNNVHPPSKELSGAVTQVLTCRDKLLKDFYSISYNTKEEFNAYNPRGVILIGNSKVELTDSTKKSSFELFRNGLSDIEVITYDELFEKIKLLLSIIE